jgi:hypothetical protein
MENYLRLGYGKFEYKTGEGYPGRWHFLEKNIDNARHDFELSLQLLRSLSLSQERFMINGRRERTDMCYTIILSSALSSDTV